MVRAPKTFQQGTLWPEFLALSEELHAHLAELTDRVVNEAIDEDVTEAAEGPPKAFARGERQVTDCSGESRRWGGCAGRHRHRVGVADEEFRMRDEHAVGQDREALTEAIRSQCSG